MAEKGDVMIDDKWWIFIKWSEYLVLFFEWTDHVLQ